MAWSTELPWSDTSLDDRHSDLVRLLRQVPAITEIRQVDASGREQLYVSRFNPDVIGSRADLSADPHFIEAVAHKAAYGRVYFLHGSEPYMTLAVAGTPADVSIAEVNLKFIWDVVSQIKVGMRGEAYVVDQEDRLIAHPNINLVLRDTDMSGLAQVRAAHAADAGRPTEPVQVAYDIQDREVLTARASIPMLGWLVLVELPVDEAFAPLYASVLHSGAILAAALVAIFLLGLVFAGRIIMPIQALRSGAARIGGGDLGHRISIRTHDELQALGHEFNRMAGRLQDSYSGLERKVEERTHQLELASTAKSRFVAAASHDLRQPLHALGLFVAQLHGSTDAAERARTLERIDSAIEAMNNLFSELLDISKLDAGVTPNITDFPVARLLKRTESTFAGMVQERGLSLKVVGCSAWVRSDPVLLERVVQNLVSNAARYTRTGGIVVGCRRRGGVLRIEVWDSGPGIEESQQRNMFHEFYRAPGIEAPQGGGLGLGLAIVDRLCRLLDHSIALKSIVGKGSAFSVEVPMVDAQLESADAPVPMLPTLNVCKGRLVVVIDDDAMALNGMSGLLETWGCQVVSAASDAAALPELCGHDRQPRSDHLGLSPGRRKIRDRGDRADPGSVRWANPGVPDERRHHPGAHPGGARQRLPSAAQADRPDGAARDARRVVEKSEPGAGPIVTSVRPVRHPTWRRGAASLPCARPRSPPRSDWKPAAP